MESNKGFQKLFWFRNKATKLRSFRYISQTRVVMNMISLSLTFFGQFNHSSMVSPKTHLPIPLQSLPGLRYFLLHGLPSSVMIRHPALTQKKKGRNMKKYKRIIAYRETVEERHILIRDGVTRTDPWNTEGKTVIRLKVQGGLHFPWWKKKSEERAEESFQLFFSPLTHNFFSFFGGRLVLVLSRLGEDMFDKLLNQTIFIWG